MGKGEGEENASYQPHRRMRSSVPRSSSRGKNAPHRMASSHGSRFSDASTVGTSSPFSSSASASGSRRSNPLRVFKKCFAGSARPTSPGSGSSGEFESKSGLTTASSTTERRRANIYGTANDSVHSQSGDMTFTMASLRRATRNFSADYKIGQGGFGTVYRGKIRNGTLVAIKRAKKTVQDKHLIVEFNSEISTLECIEHLNLVRFLGYVQQDDEKIVILEYVPNGTLREHLDGMRGSNLDLAIRLDIAIDVAHAVTYLHMYAEKPIIHRDIKSSNILLTENLRAKVTDFGFARVGATEAGDTHVSTQVKGTAGYLDPEYLRTYQLTEKSDVYSFGVLMVELISGRRPIEPKREIKERLTPKWAMKKFMDGKATEVLDPKLSQNSATILALEKILELARHCLAPTKQSRPSMRRCAEILWSIRKEYREMSTADTLSRFSNSERNH